MLTTRKDFIHFWLWVRMTCIIGCTQTSVRVGMKVALYNMARLGDEYQDLEEVLVCY